MKPTYAASFQEFQQNVPHNRTPIKCTNHAPLASLKSQLVKSFEADVHRTMTQNDDSTSSMAMITELMQQLYSAFYASGLAIPTEEINSIIDPAITAIISRLIPLKPSMSNAHMIR